MADPTPLFEESDLTGWMGFPAVSSRVPTIERVVWGWLKPATGLTFKPNPVSSELFAWAVELGAIAHENPTGLSSYQLGEERSQYSSERRDEILVAAASGGQSPGGGATVPLGSFPEAYPYPETW